MKTEFDFGKKYAEFLDDDGLVDGPVDIEKMDERGDVGSKTTCRGKGSGWLLPLIEDS